MSHFPILEYQSADAPDARTVPGLKPWMVTAARVNLGVQNLSGATTSATFVNPSVGGTVTISYSGGVGTVSAGDAVNIGVLVGYYRTGVVTTNPVSFTAYRRGPYPAATSLSSGLFVVSSAGATTNTTGTFNVPETYNQSVSTANVATPATVPSNSIVAISSRAGVFRVLSASAGSLTLFKLADGEVPAGQTIPVGVEVSSGSLLGIVKDDQSIDFAGTQLAPYDLWVSGVSSPTSVTAGPLVGLGWNGVATSGMGVYGQFIDGDRFPNTATTTYVLPVTSYRQVVLRSQNGERIAVPRNNPIMFHVRTAATGIVSGPYWVEIIFRGYYSS